MDVKNASYRPLQKVRVMARSSATFAANFLNDMATRLQAGTMLWLSQSTRYMKISKTETESRRVEIRNTAQ
jgi:hypothetical protein